MKDPGTPLPLMTSIWAALTEQQLDQDVLEVFVASPNTNRLLGFTDTELWEAGTRVRTRAGSRWALPLGEWAVACEDWRKAEYDAALFTNWVSSLGREYATYMEPEILPTLGSIIHWRWRNRWFYRAVRPTRRATRSPLGEIPGLHGLEADHFETQVALLLAVTTPSGQFSSTGGGECFIGWHSGYHHQHERIYVDGLSAALDNAAWTLDEHRRGTQAIPGGRFYVHSSGDVECAACCKAITKLSVKLEPGAIESCQRLG